MQKKQINQKTQNNFLSYDEQTIVAQCTPQGPGAIAMMRLSGVDTLDIASKMAKLPSSKSLSEQKSHTIHFGYVVDNQGQHIDQVLFLLMKAPRTFTGQNVVEITCHNNQFLVEKIIDRALQCGARLAGPGEFAQRAVSLGKMDLVQAEAMNDLIHAQTEESLKYSLQQLEGSFSSWVAQIEQSVVEMLAFCEASFEFLDEEEMEFAHDIKIRMDNLVVKIQELLHTYPKQQYIKEGIRIALVGSTNAGKSSLFNCLVNKKRAIVTDIAGTTRDVIESGVYKNGGFLTFVDTAGIRETDDRIEKEGIDRSFAEAQHADIILLVIDGSQVLSEEGKKEYRNILQQHAGKVIVVQNKIDVDQPDICEILEVGQVDCTQVSAKQNLNIDTLQQVIDAKMQELKGSGQVTCLLNKRQYSLLQKFLESLKAIEPMLQHPVEYEIVSYHLREALQLLSEVTGRSVREAAMDKVFKQFCVGK